MSFIPPWTTSPVPAPCVVCGAATCEVAPGGEARHPRCSSAATYVDRLGRKLAKNAKPAAAEPAPVVANERYFARRVAPPSAGASSVPARSTAEAEEHAPEPPRGGFVADPDSEGSE